MTAEPIAEVIADIRAGRVNHPAAFDEMGLRSSLKLLEQAQVPQPVVDCTAIYDGYMKAGKGVALYDDYPSIVPPWENAFLCYVNQFGNVNALQVLRVDWDGSAPSWDNWMTDNDVEWARVRWIAETSIWIGGRSGDGRYLPTSGPCHLLRHAIHEDGSIADINWVALMHKRGVFGEAHAIGDPNTEVWDTATVMVGAALNFLNASNVDIAEPSRPRPQRRRLARTGVTVQTIVVRPPGKHRAKSGAARPIDASETALSPVRGHWSHYGERYNRGKLFGKYEGKFWISGHVRGQGDAGPRDYVLKPGAAA
ncbi:hypothetical protein GCM10010399_63730 [Dactylosporangium fulvum]|uniref:Lysin A n=1 Tax=Dactylosporangium fulvum TaxID=53359 RepID=A0ABY5W9B1_9ACTN|nr:hypothetical protein [Dactylosporangium fulvum]UWP85804.1 hypothetical protein Dfulv_16790 [Dactylosporangium fulvum]